jgi:hypothetical protein
MSIRRHSTVRALEHAGFAEFVDARHGASPARAVMRIEMFKNYETGE